MVFIKKYQDLGNGETDRELIQRYYDSGKYFIPPGFEHVGNESNHEKGEPCDGDDDIAQLSKEETKKTTHTTNVGST